MVTNVKLFKPYKLQQDIIDAYLDPSIFYITVLCGRQVGKSLTLCNLALYSALNDAGCTIMIISPVDSQVNKLYLDIEKALTGFHGIKNKKGQAGSSVINFTNGSKILFRSALSKDSLRGNTCNYILVDESASISPDIINEILLPMLTTSGKKMVLFGTPKGKLNWTYEYYKLGQYGPTVKKYSKYKSFRFTSYDNPFANREILDNFKLSMSEKQFQQEILCEFVDSASVFNNLEELLCLNAIDSPETNKKYYGGLDFGLKSDSTILSIICDGNLVKYYDWSNIDTNELIENIKEVNKIWKFEKILAETNGIGLPIYETLKSDPILKNKLVGFTTSNKSKCEIIENLIFLFNTKAINCVNDTKLRLELENFIFFNTKNGSVSYKGGGNSHDDQVMSLAFAIECYKQYKKSGHYFAPMTF